MRLDGWRLAVGTLTAIPVRPPGRVDASTARTAMLVAPLAVAPLGVLAAVITRLGALLDVPGLITGFLAVGALAAGSRALHLDGLSDVADGLTASYDRERSLAVMKTGTSGPAGVALSVVVLGVQAAAIAALAQRGWPGAVEVGVLVCLSRWALALCCTRGVPGARPDGLGAAYVATVAPLATGLGTLAVLVVAALATQDWRGPLGVVVAGVVLGVLLVRVTRRFGGVTGDVFGAAIELALAALLIVAST